jgi:hypothetical protein
MERLLNSIARITLIASGIVFALALTIVPKSFTRTIHADEACGAACMAPGTNICSFGCPPCSGPTSGPASCGTVNDHRK